MMNRVVYMFIGVHVFAGANIVLQKVHVQVPGLVPYFRFGVCIYVYIVTVTVTL